MYIRDITIQNLKLLRDTRIPFVQEDGSPRMWTVLVGENGLCKTSVLQAIAMAASGPQRSNQLANISSLRDKRLPEAPVQIRATFDFSEAFHTLRQYPGLGPQTLPPRLESSIELPPDYSVLIGRSAYVDGGESSDASIPLDPLSDARARNLPFWFVVGYGASRNLPIPQSRQRDESDPAQERLRSLFDATQTLIGTDFISRFARDRAQEYSAQLQEALIGHGILPRMNALELRGRGGVTRPADLLESHRFEQAFERGSLRLPAVWLSHGYQSTISWVADLIGQVFQEADANVPLNEMEGIALVDEIDLHLHPRWQRTLVERLRETFPRIQFIVTTHSPMVLPGLRRHEIFIMHQDAEGSVTAAPAEDSARLMTGSEIYRSFFDIQSVYPNELGEKLRDYGYLAGNPFRTEEEEARMHLLREELRKEGIEPEWQPAPRQTLPDSGEIPPTEGSS